MVDAQSFLVSPVYYRVQQTRHCHAYTTVTLSDMVTAPTEPTPPPPSTSQLRGGLIHMPPPCFEAIVDDTQITSFRSYVCMIHLLIGSQVGFESHNFTSLATHKRDNGGASRLVMSSTSKVGSSTPDILKIARVLNCACGIN